LEVEFGPNRPPSNCYSTGHRTIRHRHRLPRREKFLLEPLISPEVVVPDRVGGPQSLNNVALFVKLLVPVQASMETKQSSNTRSKTIMICRKSTNNRPCMMFRGSFEARISCCTCSLSGQESKSSECCLEESSFVLFLLLLTFFTNFCHCFYTLLKCAAFIYFPFLDSS